MEIYNDILCIEHQELVRSELNPRGVMSKSTYNRLACIDKTMRISRKGGNGRTALIEYNSIPLRYREMWEVIFGDPYKKANDASFMGQCKFDEVALKYYLGKELNDGRTIDAHLARRYANEASVIATIILINTKSKDGSRRAGKCQKVNWEATVKVIHSEEVQNVYPHKLPINARSLQRKVKKFIDEGYDSLIHAGFGNDNSRVVTVMLERLIMALYTMPNKPFNSTAYDNYCLFMNGKITLYDRKSGELFEPINFAEKERVISETTFRNYTNNLLNRIKVDEQRNDNSYNLNNHRPFHRRRTPDFSLSKISMDDRDLPRKMLNGKRVKAYYAYDVTSGCVVGAAYSQTKDEELFLDCLRDTFRNMTKNGWGIPAEVEVENHLVNKFFDDLQVMFPLVKICIPGNHREKRAEHLNRAKKYGVEKKAGHAIGRWWARCEAYIEPQQKVNDEYVEKTFTYEDLVADDMADVRNYNLSQHPRKKYAGMSRWQVLVDMVNPNLKPINNGVLARYIGYKTKTSIRNSKEVTVRGLQYQLSSVEDLKKLQPSNKSVEAYYLFDNNDTVNEVYIYQDDKLISRCQYIAPYNEARAEWTDADRDSFTEQSKYDAQYRKMVKDSKEDIPKLAIIEEIEVLESAPKPKSTRKTKIDNSVDSLLSGYNREATIANATNNL